MEPPEIAAERQRLVALIQPHLLKGRFGTARRWHKCGHDAEAMWNWNPQTQARFVTNLRRDRE
jgi:hypothetical protein